ncbi:MAG: hypothetical protein OEV91_10340, partial [Desulfobulbaceae bacterium]|nr:hypothetical protein [Desulfobulbaceae bacterium]
NGRVVLTVPACRWLWSSHDLFLHHRRRYGANELREKIASAGLVCQRLSHFNTLLFPLAVFTRLMARLSGNHAPAGTKIPPRPVNALLRAIFSAERYLLPGLSLPLGLSLLAVLGTRE